LEFELEILHVDLRKRFTSSYEVTYDFVKNDETIDF